MLRIRFYKTEMGRKPVEEFIGGLPDKEGLKVLQEIHKLAALFPDSRGLDIRSLGRGLHELRVTLDRRSCRIIYVVIRGEILFLHGFIKKQRRASDEIETAYKRFKNFRSGQK